MAEWLIERGIGEERALLVEGDRVLAAKLRWPGELHCGALLEARLVSKAAGARRGTAVDSVGREILLDRLPTELTEGSACTVRITRAPIAEHGRYKRAQGRLAGDNDPVAANIFASARPVSRFPAGLWEEVWSEAWSGSVTFAGGVLQFSVTPAMLVVDVDGDLPARELALAAVPALAGALPRLDVGGSIGVDFPTLQEKVDRKALDEALGMALEHWPHERTAMNGFGFVQIVARLEGPSLLHRIASSRVGAAARMALRRAELLAEPGDLLLTVHPALEARLEREWLEELKRRTGREIRVEAAPGLALDGGFAQAVAR